MKNIKHLTLLHSNDLHGDFLAENIDENLIGGVSMLSGYVNNVRRSNPNTLYMIAGDMFRGSLIDSEFQGISTIEIMNALAPDIVSLGNHEVDYGIAHLLFLEKCCKFPIVNANVYIKTMGQRLFHSHRILTVDGMKILVIGILTEEIMGQAKKDRLLGTFIDVYDAATEVGRICNAYKNTDIDFTILLTHIGFENDVKLASQLDKDWGVDVIIGGHSHTYLEEPAVENDVLIVQAGIGTDQIGHFEIDIDTDSNSIDSFTWKTVPIDDAHCSRNEALEDLILNYKKITDAKYGEILTTLTHEATHPSRYQETSVGNLFCDILKDNYNIDLVLLGSGSLRKDHIGPVITKGDLMDMYSFDEKLIEVIWTGAQLKHAIEFMFQSASFDADGGHSEYYQVSEGFSFVFDVNSKKLVKATYNRCPINDTTIFTVAIEGFHADNMERFMGLSPEEVEKNGPWRTVTNNIRVSIEEYMRSHTHLVPELYGRTKA